LDEDEFQALITKAPNYGVKISYPQLTLFRTYLNELWDWNLHMNLTGLSSRKGMVVELFLDSLIPAPFIPAKGKMLDVGSGAGFPAIPLKIYIPNLKMTLIEANSKKVSFLRHVIRSLNLNEIEVINKRIEQDKGRLKDKEFPLITARALAGLGQMLSWCAPYLGQGGMLVSFLGPHAEEDLRENREVMEKQGIVLHEMIPYVLPTKKTKRNTVIFKKA
jgi:16S rRNA (guanine527-N7)-methyltransferase